MIKPLLDVVDMDCNSHIYGRDLVPMGLIVREIHISIRGDRDTGKVISRIIDSGIHEAVRTIVHDGIMVSLNPASVKIICDSLRSV